MAVKIISSCFFSWDEIIAILFIPPYAFYMKAKKTNDAFNACRPQNEPGKSNT